MLCAREDSLGDFITLTEAMEKETTENKSGGGFVTVCYTHTHKSQPYNIFEMKKMRKMLKPGQLSDHLVKKRSQRKRMIE